MLAAVIDYPILNSAFAEPSSHWELDENGIPTGIVSKGWRRSEFIVSVRQAEIGPDRGERDQPLRG